MKRILTIMLLSWVTMITGHTQTTPTFEATRLAHWDAQQSTRPSARVSGPSHRALADVLQSYDLFSLDAAAINRFVKSAPGAASFRLVLGDQYQWDLTLEENNLLAPDYQSVALTPQGAIATAASSTPTVTFRGQLNTRGGGEVRLLLDGDQLKGFITYQGTKMYLENLQGLAPDADASQFVFYSEDDVEDDGTLQCLAKEEKVYDQTVKDHINERAANGCDDQASLEIATLALYNRFNTAGGQSAVNNEILGILNNVQANYSQFSIQFKVVEQQVSTCATCDPWTTTNPGDILSRFTSWGPTGFSKQHDSGICFFKGSGSGTVGVAWVGAICTNNRYAVCDKLSTAESNRVLVAHEMGHNFGAGHDASGTATIMAPSVNNTNQWSGTSVSAINNHISSRNCLACVGGGTPPPPATCPVPTSLTSSNLGTTTVSLNWNDASNAASYRLQYRRQGTSSWTSRTFGQSQASLSGLAANTTYQWRVRTTCSSNSSSYINGPNFTTRSPSADGCTTPGNPTVYNLRQTTADFDWQNVNGANGYTYRIRVKGSSRWFTFNLSNSGISIRGMQGGITYQWQVRANCSGGSSSYTSPRQFTTFAGQMAATSDVVWAEDFELADRSTKDAAATAWTSQALTPGGSAQVEQGRFIMSHASTEWQSEKIDISALKGFKLSYDLESTSLANTESELVLSYRLDGGDWQEVDRQTEALKRKSITLEQTATGRWLELRFTAALSSPEQAYHLDNINVLCAECEAKPSAITAITSEDEVALTAYPNPYHDSFRIDLPIADEEVAIKVFDVQGRLLQSVQYENVERSIELGQDLNPGIYVVQVSAADFLKEIKITKQ